MSTSETPKSPFILSQPIGFGENLFNLPLDTNNSATFSVQAITAKTTVGTGLGSSAQIVGSNRGGKITLKVAVPMLNSSICEIHSIDGFVQGMSTSYAVTLTPASVTSAKAQIYCKIIDNKQFDIILCGDSVGCFATYEWFYSV